MGRGELFDWDLERRTLGPSRRRYENRFRTFPATDASPPVRFAVLGDFGVGILAADEEAEENALHQTRLARALERTCDGGDVLLVLTTGDNVYLDTTGTGNEDDDWYASFYAPYRYAINRVPVFPTVGNHDAGDTESSDDRDQLADNFFLEQGLSKLDPLARSAEGTTKGTEIGSQARLGRRPGLAAGAAKRRDALERRFCDENARLSPAEDRLCPEPVEQRRAQVGCGKRGARIRYLHDDVPATWCGGRGVVRAAVLARGISRPWRGAREADRCRSHRGRTQALA